MIEFGAGGQIVQNEEPAAAGPPAAEGNHTETQDENGGETAAAAEQPAEGAPAPLPTLVRSCFYASALLLVSPASNPAADSSWTVVLVSTRWHLSGAVLIF